MVGLLERGLDVSEVAGVFEFFELEFIEVFDYLMLFVFKPNKFLLKIIHHPQHFSLFTLHFPQLQFQLTIHRLDLAFSDKVRRRHLLQLIHPKVIQLLVTDFVQFLKLYFEAVNFLVSKLVLLLIVLGLNCLPSLLF